MKACGLITLFTTLMLAVGISSSRAGTDIWVGGSGNWSVANNWNPHHVPGSTDIAIITNTGNYTVTLDASIAVAGLTLGATNVGSTQMLSFNGQTLTLGGQATVNSGGQFNLSSGTFIGKTNNSGGAVFIGTLTCLGGALVGKLTMSTNSVLNLAGTSASNSLKGLIFLTNYGTVNWSNTDLYGAASLQIFNFGLWDTQTNNAFYGNGTIFNNTGTFRKSAGGATTTLDSNTTLNSSGTVDLQSGTLAIQTGTCSGIINTAGGTILNFGYNPHLITFTLTSNTTFTGSGIVEGYLNGNNAMLGGTATFSAATLYGSMTISNTGVANLVGPLGTNTFSGVLTNYGTVNWSNTDLYFSGSSSTTAIYNYGLWTTAGSNNTFHAAASFYDHFFNIGTFLKLSGGGTITLDRNFDLQNFGTVDVQGGMLVAQNGSASGGAFNVASGTTLSVGSSSPFFALYGNVNFSGSGVVEGSLFGGPAIIGGVLNYAGGGTLAGMLAVASNAVLNLPAGATFTLANLTNYGTVNWITGDLPGGGAEIDNYGLWDAKTNNTFLGGSGTTFNNYGTFRKSGGGAGGNTFLNTSTYFNNLGTVDVQSGTLNIAGGVGSGTFNAATNAGTYLFPYTLTGNPVFTGDGTVAGGIVGSNAVLHGTINLNQSGFGGTMTIASNAALNILAGLSFSQTIFTNDGTVNWYGGQLTGSSSPQIYNYGLWDDQTDNTFGATLFNNYGTFLKSGVTGGYTDLNTFNNYGTVDVQNGTLNVSGGVGSGTFNAATNAGTYLFPYTLTGNPVFTGDGTVAGGIVGSNAVLHGTINLNQSGFGGTFTIASNAALNILAGLSFSQTILTNDGTVNWYAGQLTGSSSPQIYNYGLWADQTDNTFSGAYSGGGITTFNNYGTFRKSGGAGGYTSLDTSTYFNNPGTVDVQNGTLNVNGGVGSGTFNAATNAGTYLFPYTLTGNPVFTGDGTVAGGIVGSNAVLHGTINLNLSGFAGMMTIASNAVLNILAGLSFSQTIFTNDGTVNWYAGQLTGSSSPQIYNYGLWADQTDNTFSGAYSGGGITTFNNYVTFRKSGGPGGNTVLDNSTTFNNPGTLDVQTGLVNLGGSYSLAGGTLNFGLNSSNDFGSIELASNATLAGKLGVNLNNGYSPAAGSSFALLSYGSETGTFNALNLPHLSGGLVWQTNYGTVAFTLSVSNPPLPKLSSMTLLNGGTISFGWNGVAGQTYQVQCTTNLAPANWINLGNSMPGTNGTMTVSDVIGLDSRRFYRLVVQ